MGLREDYGFDTVPVETTPSLREQYGFDDTTFAPTQRGTTGDLIHELVRGTGGSLTQLGQGLQQLGMEGIGGSLKDAGSSIQSTEIAKPDIDEAMGVKEGFLKGTARVVAGGIPDVAASAGSFIAGSAVGGPVVGTAAALGYLGTAYGAGAYKNAYEEALSQGLDEASAKDYGLKESLANFAGEAVGTGLSLASGGILGKAVVGAGIKSLISSGEYTASQVAASLFKAAGPKEFAKAFGLAGLGEGSSEVATELMNRANADTYGIERSPVDLLTLFAGSAVLGSVPAGGSFMFNRGAVTQMRDAIQVGLNHDDATVRTNVVNRLTEKLTAVDPDSANAFFNKVMPLAQKGPVDIQMVLEQEQRKEEVSDRVINKPEEVLKENNIPFKSNLRTPEVAEAKRLEELEVLNKEQQEREKYAPQDTLAVQEAVAAEEALRAEPRKLLYDGITDEDYNLVLDSKLGVKHSDFKILQDTDPSATESVRTSLKRISQYKGELQDTVVPEEREVLNRKITAEQRRVDNEFKNIGIDYKKVTEAPPKVETKATPMTTDAAAEILKNKPQDKSPATTRELPKIGGTRPIVRQMVEDAPVAKGIKKVTTNVTKSLPKGLEGTIDKNGVMTLRETHEFTEAVPSSKPTKPVKVTQDSTITPEAVPIASPIVKEETKASTTAPKVSEVPKVQETPKVVTHIANGKYSDGSVLKKNPKETKGATWIVEKGGIQYRAPGKEAAKEAIKNGTVEKLELLDKGGDRDSKWDKLLKQPMTPEQKISVEKHIEASTAVLKAQEVAEKIKKLNTEMQGKMSPEDRLQREDAIEILRGEQSRALEGVQEDYDAVQVIIKQGLPVTEDNLASTKKSLKKKEENQGSKAKPAGSVSADTLFESEKGEEGVSRDSVQVETGGANQNKLKQTYYKGTEKVNEATYKKLGSQKIDRFWETNDGFYRVVPKKDSNGIVTNDVLRASDNTLIATNLKDLKDAEDAIAGDRKPIAKEKPKIRKAKGTAYVPTKADMDAVKKLIAEGMDPQTAAATVLKDYDGALGEGYDIGKDQEGDPEPIKLARMHVRNQDGNAQKALGTLMNMWNPTKNMVQAMDWLRAIVEGHHLKALGMAKKFSGTEATFVNGADVIRYVASKEGSTASALAKFLMEPSVLKKLEDVPIELTWTGNYYKDGVIFLKDTAEVGTQLHEIVHAVTVREMESNPALKAKVTEMMNRAREYALESKLITEAELKVLQKINTSKDFEASSLHTAKDYEDAGKREIRYGLLNEKEFLAQTFGKSEFQKFLKKVPGTGQRKISLWQKLKNLIVKTFKLDPKVHTMLEDVLSITKEISLVSHVDSRARDTEASYELEYKTVDQMTAEIMRGSGPKESIKEELQKFLGSTKDLAEKIARPISDIIYSIDKRMHGALMKSETDKHLTHTEYQRGIKPFVKFLTPLTASQRTRLSVALLNYHTEDGRKVVKEMVPKEAWAAVEDTLDKISKRSIDTGLLPEEAMKDNYFPRRVKDIAGWMEEMAKIDLEDSIRKAEESKGRKLTEEELQELKDSGITEGGIIGEAFRAEAKRLDVTELTPEQKTQVMTDMFQTGHFRGLRRPGAAKERTVPFVDARTYKFYSDPVDSLTAHILDMNESLGNREFLGLSTRKAQLKRLAKRTKEIEAMESGTARDEALKLWDAENMRLMDKEGELSNGISALVYETMGNQPYNMQLKVIRMLEARIKQRGAHGVTELIRNVTYMTTMGNFISAITQIPETLTVFADKGINRHTLGGIKDALIGVARFAKNEMLGRPDISTGTIVEDLDLTRSLIEFSSGSRSTRLLETIFKYSGLKYADLLGKEAFMQSSMRFWKDPKNKEKFQKNFEPLLGKDLEETYQNFLNGKRTPSVMAVLMSELAGYQPLTLSQQSQVYLEGGNLRLAYMMKGYQLRMLSRVVMEGTERFKRASQEYDKGNKVEAAKLVGEGVRRMAALAMLVAFAGAGAEELKDLLRGRDSDFMENFHDKLLGLALLSRYTIDEGIQKEGIAKAIISSLMPPVKYIDTFGADLTALLSDEKEFKGKTFQLVPYIGTIGYAQSSAGQSSYISRERKAILEKVKENKKDGRGAYSGNLSERIQALNDRATKKEDKVTSDTISRAYKGDKKK